MRILHVTGQAFDVASMAFADLFFILVIFEAEYHRVSRAIRLARPKHASLPLSRVFRAGGRWRAQATLRGVKHHVGYYATAEEADDAVRAWRSEHMEFAR